MRSTYLYGGLRKEDDRDFSVENIKDLIRDISHIQQLTFVQAGLDNRVISTKEGALFADKKKAGFFF